MAELDKIPSDQAKVASSLEFANLTAAALTGTLTGTVNGALVDVAAAAANCGGSTTPAASDVNTAIATAVATIVSGVNEQNKEMMTMINKLVADNVRLRAALVAAGIIHAPA